MGWFLNQRTFHPESEGLTVRTAFDCLHLFIDPPAECVADPWDQADAGSTLATE